MRRPVALTAFATVLAGLGAACNGILGIGAPTLVERDGGAADGSSSHDATHDGTGDARNDVTRGDGATGMDATTDGSGPDAAHDARPDTGDAGSPSDASTFDGNCTCTGDACSPVLLAHVLPGISSVAVAPSGVCFYTVNPFVAPFPAFVGCVGWGGQLTVIDSMGDEPGTVVTRGTSLYWVHSGQVSVEECAIASCAPTSLASGGFFQGSLALGSNQLYWTESDGLHSCALTGGCDDGGAHIPGSATGDVTANSGGIFWISNESGLEFCPVAGCPDGGTPLNVDGGASAAVATDTDLYWFASTTGDIVTCPLLGGACEAAPRVLVPSTATVSVEQFAVDSTGLYWTNEETNTIERVGLDGGTVTTLAHTATGSTFSSAHLALGPTCVFWSDTSGDAGALHAVAK